MFFPLRKDSKRLPAEPHFSTVAHLNSIRKNGKSRISMEVEIYDASTIAVSTEENSVPTGLHVINATVFAINLMMTIFRAATQGHFLREWRGCGL